MDGVQIVLTMDINVNMPNLFPLDQYKQSRKGDGSWAFIQFRSWRFTHLIVIYIIQSDADCCFDYISEWII